MDAADADAARADAHDSATDQPAGDRVRRHAHRAPTSLTARLRGPLVALAVLVVAAAAFIIVHGAPGSSRTSADGTPAANRSGGPEGSGGISVSQPSATASANATASPSASPSARATPKPTPTKAHPAPPAAPATSTRKGVAAWTFNGVDKALSQSGASWYYTWATGHGGIDTPSGTEFVPMIWGSGSVTDSALAQAKANGRYILGFNEPDLSAQANMSVTQALDLWPKLEATGRTLGSPAVASGGATAGGWLDQFMTGAEQRGYRVDFIALHWYGGDFTTSDAVKQLRSYLVAVHSRYHKPIWLTEFALINFSNGTHYPSEANQAAFLTAATKMLDDLSFVQRYAWFALPASDSGPSSGLFTSGPEVTDVGRAFEAAS